MTAAYTGQLRERVTLQAQTPSLSDQGDPAYAWSNVAADLYARVEPMSSKEDAVGDRLAAVGMYEVTLRWRSGVSNSMRFLWRDRFLAIRGIMNKDERRMFLTCTCEDAGPDAGRT